jgi:hypothetical protein
MLFIMAMQSGVSPMPEQKGLIFRKKSCIAPGGQQVFVVFSSVPVFLVSSLILSSFVFELLSFHCSLFQLLWFNAFLFSSYSSLLILPRA